MKADRLWKKEKKRIRKLYGSLIDDVYTNLREKTDKTILVDCITFETMQDLIFFFKVEGYVVTYTSDLTIRISWEIK